MLLSLLVWLRPRHSFFVSQVGSLLLKQVAVVKALIGVYKPVGASGGGVGGGGGGAVADLMEAGLVDE
jgi:hypothetical protein